MIFESFRARLNQWTLKLNFSPFTKKKLSQLPVQLVMINFNYHFPWSIPNFHSLHFHSISVISASPLIKQFLSLYCSSRLSFFYPIYFPRFHSSVLSLLHSKHLFTTEEKLLPSLILSHAHSARVSHIFLFIRIVLYYLNNSWLLFPFLPFSRTFPRKGKMVYIFLIYFLSFAFISSSEFSLNNVK